MMDGGFGEIRYPHRTAPPPGEATEVAPGILWMRLPLPTALDHVNIYALDDGDAGWTVVDTGMDVADSRAAWAAIRQGPLRGRPIHRLIVTHYHPDHIGLAAWLMAQGAALWCTRLTWVQTRMLVFDVEQRHDPAKLEFWRAAGMDAATYARKLAAPPFNFRDVVGQLPPGFRSIDEGDSLVAGGRRWTVRIGNGHASGHATLWSDDGALVLAGDQALATISPNLSVYPAEPLADPVAEWLESCARLAAFATESQLVLAGHKLPFFGLPLRFRQQALNHIEALDRLAVHLAQPRVAADCFAPLFDRPVTAATYGFALGETVAHLNHLLLAGRASRVRREDGAWLWRAL